MGISNLVVKTADTFPQTMQGLISRRNRRTKRSISDEISSWTVTVGELLSPPRPLPEKSILLGRCADGLPFLMSMEDPQMGAILISGDRDCGKTHQLQVMVAAAIRIYKPHELQITVITQNPSEWDQIQHGRPFDRYLQGVFAWYDSALEEHIQRLTEIAETRRESGGEAPVNLVILDDLNFVETLSCEAQVNLRWLLEYGAQSMVWLVGALNSSYVQDLPFWLEVFRTKIFGWTRAGMDIDLAGRRTGPRAEALDPGTFRAWTGDRWLTYQLPLLGDGFKRRI